MSWTGNKVTAVTPAVNDTSKGNSGVETVFKSIDNRKFGFFHIQMIVISGMGFFTDAYDLFVIGLLTNLIGRLYYQDDPFFIQGTVSPGKLPLNLSCAVSSVALCGTLAGQIFFGRVGDVLGRKAAYGITLAIMMFAALAQSMSFGITPDAVIGTLCFWRFTLGFGVGGDYPLSATIMSEYSSTMSRGAYIGSVFAMQGVGYLVGAAAVCITCAIFIGAIQIGNYPLGLPGCSKWASDCSYAQQSLYAQQIKDTCPKVCDYIWRIVLAFGMIPASSCLYLRAHMKETARFTAHVTKDAKAVVEDATAYIQDLEVPVDAAEKVEIADLTFSQFVRKHWKELLGCAATWFLLDVAFYSQGLFQKDVFLQAGWVPPAAYMNAIEETYEIARSQAIIALGSTIPGYWFTVFFVDIMGRIKITYMGFAMMTAFMGACCGAYYQLLSPNNADNTAISSNQPMNRNGWIVMYALCFFFANFGPNATTFIMPAELFPTSWKSTGHGFCAAMGKAGAIIGAFGFLYAANPAPGETSWKFPCWTEPVYGMVTSTGACKQKNNCPTGRTQLSSTIGANCDICTPLVKTGCYPYGLGVQGALAILTATNFLGMIFTVFIPETAGKTLEELSRVGAD